MNSQNDKIIVDKTMQAAWIAFADYKNTPLKKRAALLQCIAKEIEALGETLIEIAMKETNLPKDRLHSERARTIFQLTSYGDACERGDWLEASIDTGDPQRTPSQPDIRKMRIAIGPVAVFGAANFPLAYSTAGGDTASALAAGCPVIVKAHNAHLQTSVMVAKAVDSAIGKCGFPKALFTHLISDNDLLAKELMMHPQLKAVGFTGSYSGGKAIQAYANSRKEPIPVFAEMSSVNPVFLLPQKLQEDKMLATAMAASITLGSGQFCTNPGIMVAIEGVGLESFKTLITEEIKKAIPAVMLHSGIAENFREARSKVLEEKVVSLLATSSAAASVGMDIPTIAEVAAKDFLERPVLQSEVFGSFSLLVTCADAAEMLSVAAGMQGQLTSSVMGTEDDLIKYSALINEIKNHCGRLIMNGVPTGVEVVQSMHHGGPYPSSTDSRFTSVGADAIKRFSRPLCFQNWPDAFLPDELKNSNPLNIYRTVNNEPTKSSL